MSDMLYLPTRLSLFGFKLTCFECNESGQPKRAQRITGNVVLGDRLSCQKAKKFLAPAVGMCKHFTSFRPEPTSFNCFLTVFSLYNRRVGASVVPWLSLGVDCHQRCLQLLYGSLWFSMTTAKATFFFVLDS